MNITGHNSYSGCRFCNIQGIYSVKHKHVYFHPGNYTKKNHSNWLAYINEIEAVTTTKEKESLIKKYGNYYNYYYLITKLLL
jgi:hypothetical protein